MTTHEEQTARHLRRFAMLRFGRQVSALVAGGLLVLALSGCGCRPGFVGPYGGVHPPRCWVG